MTTPEELIKPFRDQIRHEDTLFNQRITWLMTFQGFLIAPFLLIENSTNKTPVLENMQIIIVSIGIFSVGLVCLGCYAAHQSINNLINSARITLGHNKDTLGIDEQAVNYLVRQLLMRNPRYIQIAGAAPSFGSIIIISVGWFFLLQNITNIGYIYRFLLIIIATVTFLYSAISLGLILVQGAGPSSATQNDILIEKIYAGILVTIALYLITTIAYLAILILIPTTPQWGSIPIFVACVVILAAILFLIYKIEP